MTIPEKILALVLNPEIGATISISPTTIGIMYSLKSELGHIYEIGMKREHRGNPQDCIEAMVSGWEIHMPDQHELALTRLKERDAEGPPKPKPELSLSASRFPPSLQTFLSNRLNKADLIINSETVSLAQEFPNEDAVEIHVPVGSSFRLALEQIAKDFQASDKFRVIEPEPAA